MDGIFLSMTDTRKARLAELALVGVAAIWGATFVMVQDAVRHFPVMTFLAYRFVPAAAVLAPVLARELRALPAGGWRAGLWMGLFLAAGYALQTFGLQRTTVSNTGFTVGWSRWPGPRGMENLELPRAAVVWTALAVTSLLASALGFLVQIFAQRWASPARTALVLASEPAFAGLFAWLLEGETLSAAGWVGAALIMAAIVGVEAAARRAREVARGA